MGAPGDLDTGFQLRNTQVGFGNILTSLVHPDGGLLVGGNFISLNGTSTRSFDRTQVNGTLTPNFPAANVQFDYATYAAGVQTDGRILTGTGLRILTNGPSIGFSRLNPDGTADLSFDGPLTGNVFAMLLLDDGKVILGGDFRNADKPFHLMRLSANGSVDRTFLPRVDGENGSVYSMVLQADGSVIIGGTFTSVGGLSRQGLARISASGAVDRTFNPGIAERFNPKVDCLALQPDGKILVGGRFTTLAGSASQGFGRLNTDGSRDATFYSGASGTDNGTTVSSIALQADGKMVIAGTFETAGGLVRRSMAVINPDGTADLGIIFKFNGPFTGVSSLSLQADGQVVAVGSIRAVGANTSGDIARFENNTATQQLSVSNPRRIQWLRGGSSPEAGFTYFDIAPSASGPWTALGNGTRIAGGWESSAPNLPANGYIRARARIASGWRNGSQGLIETIAPYILIPDLTVRDGTGAGAPVIANGQAAVLQFGTIRQGTPTSRSLTISNPGNGDLSLITGSAPTGFSFKDPQAFPKVVEPGVPLIMEITLNADAPGAFGGTFTLNSNDPQDGTFTFPVSGIVVTPEIALHAGPGTAGPELIAGQAAAVDFNINRLGTPGVREFTIANTGTAPLLVQSVSVPAGFTLYGGMAFPATIASGTSATFTVSLSSLNVGSHSGPVTVLSDDLDEGTFTFPISGLVVTPEIALYRGDKTAGLELVSGQAEAVDFGSNIQGTPGVREFTIVNTGTAPLLVRSVSLPSGFSLDVGFILPTTIDPGTSSAFTVRLTSLNVGTHAGPVTILSDDFDDGTFTFPVNGSVFIPAPVASVTNQATVLNRQTGLREQTIRLVNNTTATVPGYQLLIAGLPAGVRVQNAAEIRSDGTAVVLVNQALAPYSSFDLVLEYSSASRLPVSLSPEITVEVVLKVPLAPSPSAIGVLAITRLVPVADGGILLEFGSRAGARYEVQYSHDGLVWKTSPSSVQAGGNSCQWIDRGPPRTDSPPAQAGKRFYRVRELAP